MQDNSGWPLEKSVTYCQLQFDAFLCAAKLYIPSTLNIDLILWHTQLIMCAEIVKSLFKSWGFPFGL